MPTYDYLCENCGHTFEKFQMMSDRVLRTCPECGKKKLRRLIGTGAGILFKGSGFYETDYRSDSYKADEKAEKESSKPKESKDSKSDSSSKKSSKNSPDLAPTSLRCAANGSKWIAARCEPP